MQKEKFGVTKDGKEVSLYTLENSSDGFWSYPRTSHRA